jgi:hypothetical protein
MLLSSHAESQPFVAHVSQPRSRVHFTPIALAGKLPSSTAFQAQLLSHFWFAQLWRSLVTPFCCFSSQVPSADLLRPEQFTHVH